MKLLFNIVKMESLVEQAEAHVIVLLLGLFLFLLLLGGLRVEGHILLRIREGGDTRVRNKAWRTNQRYFQHYML